jgi:hypothetical protein
MGCTYHVDEIKINKVQQCSVTLDVKIFLEAVTRIHPLPGSFPYMTTYLQGPPEYWYLNDKLLPVTNPYPGMTGFYHQINEPTGPAGPVVDWVLVEIWSDFKTLNLFQEEYNVIDSCVLLLKPNGTLVDTNGNKPQFTAHPMGDVRIVVKHRNHLSVMSNLVPFHSDFSYDFSEAVTQAYRLSWVTQNPQVWRNGAWCLWAGDINLVQDGAINGSDNTILWAAITASKINIYTVENVLMDAWVDSRDEAFVVDNAKRGLMSSRNFFIERKP